MDERQTQIREGAGLEESRLNVEFIDLLRKWSSPVLIVAAVVAFGFFGYQKLNEARLRRLNTAFSELSAASSGDNPSPDSLRAVASQYGGVRAVGAMARLEAADVYLRAVRLGVRIGTQPERDEAGQPIIKPEDMLTDADRADYLAQAESLYDQVVKETRGKPGMIALQTLGGLYGLAAVAECREEFDKARGLYEQIAELSEREGFGHHAAIAKERIADLDRLKTLPKIYAAAELPKPPAPPEPAVPDSDEPDGEPGGPVVAPDEPGPDQPGESSPGAGEEGDEGAPPDEPR